MEHVNRTTQMTLMGIIALLAVASLALLAAIPADAETSEISVKYTAQDYEGDPIVSFPTTGLNGEYYASLICVSDEESDENYIKAKKTPIISQEYPSVDMELTQELPEGVYVFTLVSVSDPAEILTDKFIVGGSVTVTADPSSLTVKMGSTGTISLTAPGLSLNDGHTTVADVSASLVDVVLGDRSKMEFTVTPKEAVTAGSETITFQVLFDDKAVGTATCSVTVQWADVGSVAISQSSATMYVGGSTLDLDATVTPTNANPAVTWSSSDTTVATVDENGVVTAVSVGTADITATSNGDPTKTAKCSITVEAKTLQSISITTPPDKTIYTVGEYFDPTGMVITAVYNSGSETVDPDECTFSPGVGEALELTDTTVTVSFGGKTASQAITVSEDTPIPTGIRLSSSSVIVDVDDSGTLAATILPEGAIGTVRWTTTNPNIVSISSNGLTAAYVAQSSGTATVTATIAGTQISASCTFTVSGGTETVYVAEVDGVKFSTMSAAIYAAQDGGTVRLLDNVDAVAVQIPEGYSLTLDLNGKSLTCEDSVVVNDGASLTIIGDGAVVGNDAEVGAVANVGTLKIEGGRYSAPMMAVANGGELVITGGTFVGSDFAVVSVSDVEISGGTFEAPMAVYLGMDANLNVSGGTFSSNIPIAVDQFTGTISVSGGSFSGKVPDQYIADGFVQQYTDGWYVIVSEGSADPDVPDYPVIPPYNPDDDYVPIPPTIVDNRSDDDDATKIVACAAAAVAAAILAAFIIMEYRKR